MRIWVSILLLWAVGVALSIPARADFDQSPAVLCPDAGYGDITPVNNNKSLNSLLAPGSGKKPVKIPQKAISTLNNAYNSNTSDLIFETSVVECHQELGKLLFPVNLVDTPSNGSPSVEVLISLRSGWSPVLVGQYADNAHGLTRYHRKETPAC